MEGINYEIVDSVPPNDRTWLEWKNLVESEGWTSDDLSVLTLTPKQPTTRIVLARKKTDGSFIGSVVWNEYDNIAYIGFYLMHPEHRGKGVGSIIWKRALERIPRNYTIVLRAVPYMIPRYKSRDTPFEGPRLNAYEIDAQTLLRINYNVKKVNELTKEECHQMEQFDLSVVKRDRSEFLRRFHELPFTFGSVLFNSDNQIVACAAVCPTLHSERHLFKLAPLYASSLQQAFMVIKPLISEVKNVDDKGRFVLQTLSGTIGSTLFPPLFASVDDVSSRKCGLSLFSRTFENPIDIQRLFIPHNNSCHFDA
uniref:N-acetyltransferase domain-containing protein n=1 Tax=Angiostrongylus cantonensis TaxID=6313 RepID=A0A0K0DH66_ANGCA